MMRSIMSRKMIFYGLIVLCFIVSGLRDEFPVASITPQQYLIDREQKMEYDDLVRHYSSRPRTWRFGDDETQVKLMITAIDGDEQSPTDRDSSTLSRLNERKVEYGCRISNDGRIAYFYHSSMGAKGSGYPAIPESKFERLNQLLENLPDDGSRLPPAGRRLVVQVAETDHYRVRVYDRANAPAEILEVLRLSGSQIRSWLPMFQPSSEWAGTEQSKEVQICLSPDGRQIITSAANDPLKFWDPDTHEMVEEVNLPQGISARGLSFTPNGLHALIQGWGEVCLLDTRTWRSYRKLVDPLIGRNRLKVDIIIYSPAPVFFFPKFTTDGRFLLLNSNEPTLKIFDTKTWQRQPMLPDLPPDALTYVPATTTKRAVYFSRSEVLGLWNPENRSVVAKLDDNARIHQAAFSPDESLVAVATAHKVSGDFWGKYRIRVWRMADGELLHELRPFEQTTCEAVDGLFWLNDGNYILAATKSHSFFTPHCIDVWSMKSGRHRGELIGCPTDVSGLALLDDGRRIVAGCGDGHIRVWNLASAIKQIDQFEGSLLSDRVQK